MTKINSHLVKTIALLLTLPALAGMDSQRDPTLPPNLPSATTTETPNIQPINLYAVFIRENYRAAVINGQTYYIGDHFNEYIITKILPDAVELTGADNTHEVIRLAAPVRY